MVNAPEPKLRALIPWLPLTTTASIVKDVPKLLSAKIPAPAVPVTTPVVVTVKGPSPN